MSQEVSSTNKRIAKIHFSICAYVTCHGVSIFTSRVILQTLGVEDYGIYNAVGGIVAVIECLTVPCLHQPVVFWLTNWE